MYRYDGVECARATTLHVTENLEESEGGSDTRIPQGSMWVSGKRQSRRETKEEKKEKEEKEIEKVTPIPSGVTPTRRLLPFQLLYIPYSFLLRSSGL